MASKVLELGRWTLLTALAVTAASACGGRGNLPGADGNYGDDEGGSSGGGGSSGRGGSRPIAGSTSAGVGGSIGVAGTAAGGNVGVAGSPGCADGAPCPVPFLCLNGQCLLPEACAAGQTYCAGSELRRCNEDGRGYALISSCMPGTYCDATLLGCRPGLCAPNAPVCQGELATTCNQNGSGYVGMGVDCAQEPFRHCDSGKCVCDLSRLDCDGDAGNGCETSAQTDPDNCGGCSIFCSTTHMATRTCNGACDGTCQAGFDDCNGDKQHDGCETDIDTGTSSCGGCGIQCADNHVAVRCSNGTCDGACDANFSDCNLDKQSDGCESDSRSDVNNCGACGTRCSSNHISRTCSAGQCGGACTTGFADCNANKQTDGCETDTRSDALNCGSCGKVCGNGQTCSNGTCSSALFTFSGIKQDLAVSSLTGWSECFSDTYGETVPMSTVLSKCTGKQLLMACRRSGSSTLQLAAHAPRTDVLFDTGIGNELHIANGVGWYWNDSRSWGFAVAGDTVNRYTCDIEASSLQLGGTNGDKRLCWHTSANVLQGGWRCGINDNLNADFAIFERVLFQAP